jgi:hypothetical protein
MSFGDFDREGAQAEQRRLARRDEFRRRARMTEAENIATLLDRGARLVKAGHAIKGINPDGHERMIPLSPTKREKLEDRFKQLKGVP